MGHRRQMQRRVGRTTGRGDDDRGVLEGFAAADIARADTKTQQVHRRLARGFGILVTRLVGGRRTGRSRQGKADRLGHAGHGVGGELAAAGAGRRTGGAFQLVQVGVGELASGMHADAFEDIDDGDVLAAELARQDRATIHEDRRDIEAQHRHHHAGQRLVATGERDHRVVAMAAHRELDRIGNQVAAGQRGLHALVPHGDAVGHRDGGEFARCSAPAIDTDLHGLSLAIEGDVAGGGLVPAGRHAYQRLVDLLLVEAHGVKVGAMRRPLRSDRGVTARHLRLVEGRIGMELGVLLLGHCAWSPPDL